MNIDELGVDIKELREVLESLPQLFASLKIQAKTYRAAYDALLSENFTEEQAMEILKSRGPFLS